MPVTRWPTTKDEPYGWAVGQPWKTCAAGCIMKPDQSGPRVRYRLGVKLIFRITGVSSGLIIGQIL